jgi:hypothetical protein
MAQVGGVEFSNRRECLEGFARTLGVYPPRAPIPEWWEHFEKWYREVRAVEKLRKEDDPSVTSLMVRLEAFEYEDESEEGDEDDFDDRFERQSDEERFDEIDAQLDELDDDRIL